MKPSEWLILADDATGALDTGVQIAKFGITSYVYTNVHSENVDSPPVAVVNLESRHDAPELARAKVRDAILRFPSRYIYKKTDSVLRGNVGPEIAALHSATGASVCFVPFYPAQGRTTAQGIQYVGGIPVDRSPFAHDPRSPARSADIPALLAESDLRSAVVEPPYSLPHPLPDVLIFDGETEDDLRAATRLIAEHGLFRAVAGCAGFAAHLPVSGGDSDEVPLPSGPYLLLSGSASPVTLRQIEAARYAGIPVLAPDTAHLRGEADFSDALARCSAHLRAGQSVVLASAVQGVPLTEGLPEGLLQDRLAAWAALLIGQNPDATWMAVGGDFLSALFRALDIRLIRPRREILPGIPFCTAGRHHFLTKSGGFGNTNTLIDIIKGG